MMIYGLKQYKIDDINNIGGEVARWVQDNYAVPP